MGIPTPMLQPYCSSQRRSLDPGGSVWPAQPRLGSRRPLIAPLVVAGTGEAAVPIGPEVPPSVLTSTHCPSWGGASLSSAGLEGPVAQRQGRGQRWGGEWVAGRLSGAEAAKKHWS